MVPGWLPCAQGHHPCQKQIQHALRGHICAGTPRSLSFVTWTAEVLADGLVRAGPPDTMMATPSRLRIGFRRGWCVCVALWECVPSRAPPLLQLAQVPLAVCAVWKGGATSARARLARCNGRLASVGSAGAPRRSGRRSGRFPSPCLYPAHAPGATPAPAGLCALHSSHFQIQPSASSAL